jgi:hypothetical protein
MLRSVSRHITKVNYRAFSTVRVQNAQDSSLFDKIKEKASDLSSTIADKAGTITSTIKEKAKDVMGSSSETLHSGRSDLSKEPTANVAGGKPKDVVDHGHWEEAFSEKDENFTTTHANAFRDDTADWSTRRKAAGKPLVWDQDAKKTPEEAQQATMRMGEEKLWREGKVDEIKGRDMSAK